MVWLLAAALLLGLRQLVLVLLGIAALCLHLFYGDGRPEYLIYDVWEALNQPQLLAVVLFLFAAAIMTRGASARRLIDFSLALTRPLPGGLAFGALLAMAGFATVAGSAIIALVAIGPALYAALLENNYEKRFAIGLLCASSVFGLVVPPSSSFILYGALTGTAVPELFVAGIGPALVLIGLLAAYIFVRHARRDRGRWAPQELWEATQKALPALVVPIVILSGIYTGYLTLTEAGLVAVVLAVGSEVAVHGELDGADLWEASLATCRQFGTLVLIFAFAASINTFLLYQQVPQQLLAVLQGTVDSRGEFLLFSNLLMLFAGLLLDGTSALLVTSSLLEPLAQSFGITSVHYATMLVLNLGLGCLLPPAGTILLAAMTVFEAGFIQVVRAVIPVIGILLTALVVVTLVPGISNFL